MLRAGLWIGLLSLLLVLSGCASAEDRQAEGIAAARAVFEEAAPEPNDTAGGTELYVPSGYQVEQPADDYHVLITRGGETYTLSRNPNEAPDSSFFYDLQKANLSEGWLVDEKFSRHGRFGFVTVREVADGRYELVVSSGGTKLSTITERQALNSNMNWMMKTVRSVEAADKE